jgi:hypothetical protein
MKQDTRSGFISASQTEREECIARPGKSGGDVAKSIVEAGLTKRSRERAACSVIHSKRTGSHSFLEG